MSRRFCYLRGKNKKAESLKLEIRPAGRKPGLPIWLTAWRMVYYRDVPGQKQQISLVFHGAKQHPEHGGEVPVNR